MAWVLAAEMQVVKIKKRKNIDMRKTLIFMAAVAAMVCGGTAEASAKVYDRDTAVAEADYENDKMIFCDSQRF